MLGRVAADIHFNAVAARHYPEHSNEEWYPLIENVLNAIKFATIFTTLVEFDSTMQDTAETALAVALEEVCRDQADELSARVIVAATWMSLAAAPVYK